MKKKVILIALALVIISLFLMFKFNSGAKTIEEAINTTNSKQVSIIYEEKNDKGSIVFCYTSGEVKIIEKKRNIESQAKIINANGTRIWLVYMNKFEGSDFDIIGLSEDGKELTKIDGDISPYYAEQKPFKGY
jgi:hypothetical protein